MKKILVSTLLILSTLLASCAHPDPTVSEYPSDDSGAAVSNTTQINDIFTSDYYATLRSDRGASLIIGGSNAQLTLIGSKGTKKLSGALTADGDTLTVGKDSFKYKLFDGKIILADGSDVYLLEPTSASGSNLAGVALIASSWSGDGMSLSFDGMVCTLTVNGKTYSNPCTVSDGSFSIDVENTNLALTATAAASGVDYPDHQPVSAIDGSTSTRWGSPYQNNQHITVDLKSEHQISAVRLMWESAAGKDYKIQLSTDGSTWTDAVTVKNNSVTNEFITYTFDKSAARYVRMFGETRTTKYGFSLWEIEIYEDYSTDISADFSISNGKLTVVYEGKQYILTAN